MNVLICSQYGEIQVEEVCTTLRKAGVNPVLFERYRKDQFISYNYGKKEEAFLRIRETEYPLNSQTFSAVWYRAKPILQSEIPGSTSRIEEKFCFQEWRVILQSIDRFLVDSLWINPILNSHRASNKAYQLKVAKEFSLKIPETVVTNDSNKVLELFQNHRRVIYKTLSSFFTSEHTIYTNEIFYDQVAKK